MTEYSDVEAATTAWDTNRRTVVIVEDNEKVAKELVEEFQDEKLNGNDVNLDVVPSLEASDLYERLAAADFVVLDLYEGDPAKGGIHIGPDILEKFQGMALCPIVVFSAFAEWDKDEPQLLIRYLKKSDGVEAVRLALEEMDRSGAMDLFTTVVGHVQSSARNYVWRFINTHFDAVPSEEERADAIRLLMRRLSIDLGQEATIAGLLKEAKLDGAVVEGKVHPSEVYILPPTLNEDLMVGDILRHKETDKYIAILQPSCDLATRGNPPSNQPIAVCPAEILDKKHKVWKTHQDELASRITKKKDIRSGSQLGRIFSNNESPGRHYLPPFREVPQLLLAFKDHRTEPLSDLMNTEKWIRIAGLSPPFAEYLSNRYSQYMGRIGVPDLDVDGLLRR